VNVCKRPVRGIMYASQPTPGPNPGFAGGSPASGPGVGWLAGCTSTDRQQVQTAPFLEDSKGPAGPWNHQEGCGSRSAEREPEARSAFT